ncbi:MAG: undecaprenyl-diphosphatase 2 [Candidatus Binatia bacterium]|nr:MAG: undecaprenyl-diphosphatase 2 [Candidatus Binatia bacterium]
MLWWKALILGVVEGVTEFLPISSTGHLILVSTVVDYPEAQRATFDISIQLGAVLALVWLYRDHLWSLVQRAPSDPVARSLMGKLALAFLPAALAGYLFHHWIENHLFNTRVVAWALVGGGVALLWVDQRKHEERTREIEAVSWQQAIWVGTAQTLSLVPGVSRAAATILGGLMCGLSRPVATQFSFYLSIPTLAAASLYSLYKVWDQLLVEDLGALAVGFVAAFASAFVVVEAFLRFVQRHTFLLFALYRIALGLLLIFWLV